MVKIQYIGPRQDGIIIAHDFKLDVVKGKIYDLPSNITSRLLKTGDWKIISESKASK